VPRVQGHVNDTVFVFVPFGWKGPLKAALGAAMVRSHSMATHDFKATRNEMCHRKVLSAQRLNDTLCERLQQQLAADWVSDSLLTQLRSEYEVEVLTQLRSEYEVEGNSEESEDDRRLFDFNACQPTKPVVQEEKAVARTAALELELDRVCSELAEALRRIEQMEAETARCKRVAGRENPALISDQLVYSAVNFELSAERVRVKELEELRLKAEEAIGKMLRRMPNAIELARARQELVTVRERCGHTTHGAATVDTEQFALLKAELEVERRLETELAEMQARRAARKTERRQEAELAEMQRASDFPTKTLLDRQAEKVQEKKECTQTVTSSSRFHMVQAEEVQEKKEYTQTVTLSSRRPPEKVQIDWHDSVVMETTQFTAEDDGIAVAAPIIPFTMATKGARFYAFTELSDNVGAVTQEPKIKAGTELCGRKYDSTAIRQRQLQRSCGEHGNRATSAIPCSTSDARVCFQRLSPEAPRKYPSSMDAREKLERFISIGQASGLERSSWDLDVDMLLTLTTHAERISQADKIADGAVGMQTQSACDFASRPAENPPVVTRQRDSPPRRAGPKQVDEALEAPPLSPKSSESSESIVGTWCYLSTVNGKGYEYTIRRDDAGRHLLFRHTLEDGTYDTLEDGSFVEGKLLKVAEHGNNWMFASLSIGIIRLRYDHGVVLSQFRQHGQAQWERVIIATSKEMHPLLSSFNGTFASQETHGKVDPRFKHIVTNIVSTRRKSVVPVDAVAKARHGGSWVPAKSVYRTSVHGMRA